MCIDNYIFLQEICINDTKCNETNCVSPVALFDNAAPLKSRRGVPSRFQGRHIPRRSVVLAPAYHIGQQTGASNLSGAKP